jgi:hypothetical protein
MRRLILPAWLIFFAIIALWINSYFGSNTFYRIGDRRALAVDCYGGEFSFWAGTAPLSADVEFGRKHYPPVASYTTRGNRIAYPQGSEVWFLGFGLTNCRRFPCSVDAPITSLYGVVIPFWFAAGASGTIALFLSVRFSAKRIRRREGLCEACGYDLRASNDRCPECGAPINASTISA